MPDPMLENRIVDSFGRPLEYLRLSVTDRCNLRCFYCMPDERMKFLPKKELLSYEELGFVVHELVELGIKKLRITGGEPFVRQDMMGFLTGIVDSHPELELGITSNGVLLGRHIKELKALGIQKINLSLDSFDPSRFLRITARDDFQKVYACLLDLIESGFQVKINCVVMKGVNDHEIPDFAEFARTFPVSIRFIEEMPFNGHGKQRGFLSYDQIKAILEEKYGILDLRQSETSSSSFDFAPSGFEGSIGIIPAYTRSFCGSCNRIRISATGQMKNCLYGKNVLDLRELIRSGRREEIKQMIINKYKVKEENGVQAEKGSELVSMSMIGG